VTNERKDEMAYLVTHLWPGATIEQYKTTVGVLWPPNGPPDGEIWHAAGATEGGVLIAAVWESKEHFDRYLSDTYLSDTVMPSMPVENGLTGQPEQRTADIASLVDHMAA
jgi:hypothetical protein